MSPLKLEILLHYYYSPVDYRDGDFSASAVRDAINQFTDGSEDSRFDDAGMLMVSPRDGQSYTLSPRGRLWIDHLLAQPLPVQIWTIPPSPGEPK